MGGKGRAPPASRPLGAVGGAGLGRAAPPRARACSLSRARAVTEGGPGPKFAAGRPCGPPGAAAGGKRRGRLPDNARFIFVGAVDFCQLPFRVLSISSL